MTISDTYGSYASSGMYGNHASINYVFGQLGGHQSNRSVDVSHVQMTHRPRAPKSVMIARVPS